MPVVVIQWYEGRDAEQKAEIARRVTDLLVEVGKTRAEDVWVRFEDSPKENWAIGGELQG